MNQIIGIQAGVQAGANRISAAIATFQPNIGFKIIPPPPKLCSSSSPIWTSGVRVQSIANPADISWYCLAGSCFCEGKGKKMHAHEKSNSNLTDHLREKHGIVSQRSTCMKSKREQQAESKTKHARVLSSMAPERYHGLSISNLFVGMMIPFSYIEDPRFRATLLADMPPAIQKMTPEKLKRHILELYVTTKSFTMKLLADAKECTAGLPTFHLNVDLWTSKISGMKYLGIRLYFVDRHFNYSSRLLAVKPFNPATEMRESAQLSDILFIWVKDVLLEYTLSPSDLLSATTDSGGDIQRLGNVVIGCKWDWCLPHLLNCALVDAFGTSVDPARSKNREVRDVLMNAKRCIEYVNKSHPAQVCLDEVQREHGKHSLHLLSDVPQRWKSTVNLLERLLLIWKEVRLMYSTMGKAFPIDADHTLLLQLYSMLLPIAAIMTAAQGGSFPEGPNIAAKLSIARQKVLNLLAPLEVFDPAAPETQRRTMVDADELHPLAQATRLLLLDAIDKRFFQRYANLTKRSGMLDMCCFLYPPLKTLPYIRFLLPVGMPVGSQEANEVEEKIRSNTAKEIRRLAIKVAKVKLPTVAEAVARAGPVNPAASAGSRAASLQTTVDFLALFGPPAEVVEDTVPLAVTAESIVDEELRRYKETHVSGTSLPLEDSLRFWRENKELFPTLAITARAVFGFAISAAGVERDFSVGGNFITRKRGKLDEAIVEMMLFLNINEQDIPTMDLIVTLSDHVKLKTHLPERFRTRQFKAVSALTMSLADDRGHEDPGQDPGPESSDNDQPD